MGAPLQINLGTLYGRLTPLEVIAHKVRCVCACGVELLVTKSNLNNGNTKSCGCLRKDTFKSTCLQDPSAHAKKGWELGWYDRERSRNLALRNSEQCKGRPAKGESAKGVENCHAKFYAVMSPSGVVIEGLNLSQVVRDNAHMFSQEDMVWRKNSYGTDTYCKAMVGLRSLFRREGRECKTWKGWTKVAGPYARGV